MQGVAFREEIRPEIQNSMLPPASWKTVHCSPDIGPTVKGPARLFAQFLISPERFWELISEIARLIDQQARLID